MGLSGIAKAPVSHGVEPHDLETGGLALASALAFRLYRSSLSPPLPRERFSARAESGLTGVASGTTAVRAIAAIAWGARNRLHCPKRPLSQTLHQRLRLGDLGHFRRCRKAFERGREDGVGFSGAAGRLAELGERERREQLEASRAL